MTGFRNAAEKKCCVCGAPAIFEVGGVWVCSIRHEIEIKEANKT